MGKEEAGEMGAADLADAIEALRDALERAGEKGRGRKVNFRLDPIELTVQVGVTRNSKGSAGLRWQILTVDGERSRQATVTHTLMIRLTPVLAHTDGAELPEEELLISDFESGPDVDR